MYLLSALLLVASLLAPHQHQPTRPAAPGISRIAYETVSGGRLGGYSSLVITADSTVYVEGTRVGRQVVRAKTTKATWAALAKAVNLSSLRQLKSQPSHLPVDGADATLTITQGQETISRVNGEDDAARYQAMRPFAQLLDAQLTRLAAQINR